MQNNASAGAHASVALSRRTGDITLDKGQRSGGDRQRHLGRRACAMATSKRWVSEGDLTPEMPARKRQRREAGLPGRALVALVTTDGAAMMLDVSPQGRFAARFSESHLLGETDVDSKADDHADYREVVLPVDRASLVPVYAYVTIDGADFGSCGALDTNALISSSLCPCVDRLDAIQAAADAIGVPAAAARLRRWVDLAAPDPTSYAITTYPDAHGIAVRCRFAPRDSGALIAEMGPEATERLCAAVARHRLGTEASPLVQHVMLARLDEPLRARIVGAGAGDADATDADGTFAACRHLFRKQMPFLLATSDLPDVDGAYARCRRVLQACRNEPGAGALADSLDDLGRLAHDMPERVRVDNPYHIMAALAAPFPCPDTADPHLGAKALAAAVDANTNLLGLLADAARLALGTPHAIGALVDAHMGALCLGPRQRIEVDQAIRAYYDHHDHGDDDHDSDGDGDAHSCSQFPTIN
ncbi:hypothetical protein pneo_cds_316 [Pandoravirus neocaledonia]|uniref:Uncharacterized protein n=1 Tax=Pandoravirus neocaledonia TaxID=2107708 RepID=A0A2U7UBW2_9VIRU|nr:hypothetical protein pneo_cds_316 [Pandoravirus neocaledonia]AVK75923.1 hypothetical protein pneo_cds_316 [Pandoravirus neocaledonia]